MLAFAFFKRKDIDVFSILTPATFLLPSKSVKLESILYPIKEK